jgi:tetratricopeptide (TPR) repeat protein
MLPLYCQSGSVQQQEIQSHLQKAQEDLKSGNGAGADQEFRAILALDPENTDARANLGVLRYLQGDWAGASQYFQEVLRVQPSLVKAQALLGLCQERLGQPARARELLEASVPHLQGALQAQAGLDLIGILYQAGDFNGALDIVRLLERASPANEDVLYSAYRTYSELAYRARDALATVAPDSARMHELIAEHLVIEGDLAGALLEYQKALAIDPKLPGARYELGETILHNSNSDSALAEAEKDFREVLAENPSNAGAEYWLGTVATLRHDFKGAIESFSRALQLQPDHAGAQLGLGKALMEIGEPEKAEEHLLLATRLDPTNPAGHYRLVTLYRRMGRESDASHELSVFNELQASKKRIEQVYRRMHVVVPATDGVPADATR